MNIQECYTYSWFSSLAYVDWNPAAVGLDKNQAAAASQAIKDAQNANRIPGADGGPVDTLGEKIFRPDGLGWRIADFQPNDAVGFSASLFVKQDTQEKVLAIRGTEPTSEPFRDLLKADIHEIGEYGMAISQAVSLFNYVQRLRAPTSDIFVPQLELRYRGQSEIEIRAAALARTAATRINLMVRHQSPRPRG